MDVRNLFHYLYKNYLYKTSGGGLMVLLVIRPVGEGALGAMLEL